MGLCLSLSERRSAPALITMPCLLLLLLAACWVRKHELSTLASPSDMHRMAMSARSEGKFPARSTRSACKNVYRGCTESEKVYFPNRKEPSERVCNNTEEKISVLLYNQEAVQMSHPVGLSGVHLHSAHSSSNTALIKWLDEWCMGGSLTEPGKPFLCTPNPGRSGWRETGEDKARRYFQWQFTDSKINDPTHKGPEQRSLLIRHPGPPPPPGRNPYESYRFQWPINERPWQTTLSLTPPPSLPALHLDNLILYHRKKKKRKDLSEIVKGSYLW